MIKSVNQESRVYVRLPFTLKRRITKIYLVSQMPWNALLELKPSKSKFYETRPDLGKLNFYSFSAKINMVIIFLSAHWLFSALHICQIYPLKLLQESIDVVIHQIPSKTSVTKPQFVINEVLVCYHVVNWTVSMTELMMGANV